MTRIPTRSEASQWRFARRTLAALALLACMAFAPVRPVHAAGHAAGHTAGQATTLAGALQVTSNPRADDWLAKAPTSADVVIYAEGAGAFASRPEASLLTRDILGLTPAGQTIEGWRAFAASMQWTSEEAFDNLLGRRFLFAASAKGDDPIGSWVLVMDLAPGAERRIRAALDPKPRKQLRRTTVYAFERGEYILVFGRREAGSVRTIIAPASSESLLVEAIDLAIDDVKAARNGNQGAIAGSPIVVWVPGREGRAPFVAGISPGPNREWTIEFRGRNMLLDALIDAGPSHAFACDPRFELLPESTVAAFVGAAPSIAQGIALLATGSDLLGAPRASDGAGLQNLGPTSTLVFGASADSRTMTVLGARRCEIAPQCVGAADGIFASSPAPCPSGAPITRANFGGLAPEARRRVTINASDSTLAEHLLGDRPTLIWEFEERSSGAAFPGASLSPGWVVMQGVSAGDTTAGRDRKAFTEFLGALDAGCANEGRIAAGMVRPAKLAKLGVGLRLQVLGPRTRRVLGLMETVQWEIFSGPGRDTGSLHGRVHLQLRDPAR